MKATSQPPVVIATRGSALALVQANAVLDQCRRAFPDLEFELKVIKTTGDKLQTIALTNPNQEVTKGLFTKELEVALLSGEADLAVHSLKDLPTELPDGLQLSAVSQRADVRDVLIHRDARIAEPPINAQAGGLKRGMFPNAKVKDFWSGAVVATSSTRRQAQLLALRPDLKLVPIRGNVGTRLQKLATQDGLDGLVLAAAGLERLGIRILDDGSLAGENVPSGLLATPLTVEEMLPCVGQAALGIESRIADPRIQPICSALNHPETEHCVTAERAFLQAMGGGCLSPVAALAMLERGGLWLRAVSFRDERVRRGELRGPVESAAFLGREMAGQLASNE